MRNAIISLHETPLSGVYEHVDNMTEKNIVSNNKYFNPSSLSVILTVCEILTVPPNKRKS